MKIINKFLLGFTLSLLGLFVFVLVRTSPEITPWYVGRLAGIFAFILFSLTVCMGLLMTSKILLKIPFLKSPDVLATHQYTATYMALGFTILHIVSFMYDEALSLTFREILIPFSTTLDFDTLMGINIQTGMALGTCAFYLCLVLITTSRLRKRLISLKIWRAIHYSSFLFYILFLSHAYFTGSDSTTWWMQTIYGLSLTLVLTLLCFRIFGRKFFMPQSVKSTVNKNISKFPLPKKQTAKVSNLRYLDVRDLEATLITNREFSFLAGQFISINVGNGLYRAYSIATSPNASPEIKIVASVAHEGVGAHYLKNIKVGDKVEFIGPSGRFVLPDTLSDKLIFIATGTGIAPLLSMIEKLNEQNYMGEITVLFGIRNQSELFYQDRLLGFTTKFKKFQFRLCYSQEMPTDNDETMLLGRVQDATEIFDNPDKKANYFICGNPFMVTDVLKLLENKGVEKTKVFHEKFTVSKPNSNK